MEGGGARDVWLDLGFPFVGTATSLLDSFWAVQSISTQSSNFIHFIYGLGYGTKQCHLSFFFGSAGTCPKKTNMGTNVFNKHPLSRGMHLCGTQDIDAPGMAE